MPNPIPIPEAAIESSDGWYMLVKHAHESATKDRQQRLNEEER